MRDEVGGESREGERECVCVCVCPCRHRWRRFIFVLPPPAVSHFLFPEKKYIEGTLGGFLSCSPPPPHTYWNMGNIKSPPLFLFTLASKKNVGIGFFEKRGEKKKSQKLHFPRANLPFS